MTVERRLLAVCACLALVAACGRPDEGDPIIDNEPLQQEDDVTTFEPDGDVDATLVDEQTIRGELRSVDLEQQRLMVMGDGNQLHEIEYSDETVVLGADSSGVQGLAAESPGTRVLVRFEENELTGTKTAVSIELE